MQRTLAGIASKSNQRRLASKRSDTFDALKRLRFLRERQDREREDYLLLGDFGIGAPTDIFARVLEQCGFNVPEALTRRRANLDPEHYYDQIAFRPVEDRLELAGSGVFRPLDAVFRDNDDGYNA